MSRVGLPPNWWAYTSDNGTYYYNEITKETTWDKPAFASTVSKPTPTPAPVASLMPGIYIHIHEFIFYFLVLYNEIIVLFLSKIK